MMASTHTISSRVKPRCRTLLIFRGGVVERNVGGNPAATFLAVGPVGYNVIRTVLSGRTIYVTVVPRVLGDVAALQIRPVPGRNAWRLPDQCRQSFRGGGETAGIEIEQVERAREALQLDLCRLDLGFAEIIENARADQAHDEADDGDHHQHLDQREALLAGIGHEPVLCGPFFARSENSTDAFERYH